MAEKLLKEHLYGDLLAPTPGYFTDFALGMTYCLSFEAMLTAHLAFGMLGEMDDNVIQSPHLLLEAITKSSEKVVVFCNKGGIAVPPTIRKVYSLMERNIFEVFDKQNNKANFHPKLWLIREINNDDKKDVLLKLIVTSRNLAYTDTIDCIACLTGKVGSAAVKNEKHQPLVAFIKSVIKESNIGDEQKKSVLKLTTDLVRVEQFDVDAPFEDYDFPKHKKPFHVPGCSFVIFLGIAPLLELHFWNNQFELSRIPFVRFCFHFSEIPNKQRSKFRDVPIAFLRVHLSKAICLCFYLH